MDKYNPYVLVKEKKHISKEGTLVRLYTTPFSTLDTSRHEAKQLVILDLHAGLIPEPNDIPIQMVRSRDRQTWLLRYECMA